MRQIHIKTESVKDNFGRFVVEPLEQGYGHTLGASLRRVLLTSLPGAAITQVKISGLKHQFATVDGVKEDGVDLLLNLKKVRVEYKGDETMHLTLLAKGAGEVTAGQIKAPTGVKISNPDQVIATLSDSKSNLEIDIQVESGVGYSSGEERRTSTIGVIPVDADFSPVRRVNYKVEETRVGRLTNFDKLTIEVWTDGTISPADSVKRAAEILISYLQQIVSPDNSPKEELEVLENVSTLQKPSLNLSVEELNLPMRISNALVKAGYDSVDDLVTTEKQVLAKVRNLGEKSVKVVEDALLERGISWDN